MQNAASREFGKARARTKRKRFQNKRKHWTDGEYECKQQEAYPVMKKKLFKWVVDWLKGKQIRNAVSKIIELEVAEHYYLKTGEAMFIPVGYWKPYDGISQSRQLSFEVKFEQKASETFNLCFEHSYKGKPSGIVSTEAQRWVHVVPITKERMCCYEFEVDTLRDALRGFPLYSGGDGNKSRMKLLPMAEAERLKSDKFFIEIKWDEFKPYW